MTQNLLITQNCAANVNKDKKQSAINGNCDANAQNSTITAHTGGFITEGESKKVSRARFVFRALEGQDGADCSKGTQASRSTSNTTSKACVHVRSIDSDEDDDVLFVDALERQPDETRAFAGMTSIKARETKVNDPAALSSIGAFSSMSPSASNSDSPSTSTEVNSARETKHKRRKMLQAGKQPVSVRTHSNPLSHWANSSYDSDNDDREHNLGSNTAFERQKPIRQTASAAQLHDVLLDLPWLQDVHEPSASRLRDTHYATISVRTQLVQPSDVTQANQKSTKLATVSIGESSSNEQVERRMHEHVPSSTTMQAWQQSPRVNRKQRSFETGIDMTTNSVHSRLQEDEAVRPVLSSAEIPSAYAYSHNYGHHLPVQQDSIASHTHSPHCMHSAPHLRLAHVHSRTMPAVASADSGMPRRFLGERVEWNVGSSLPRRPQVVSVNSGDDIVLPQPTAAAATDYLPACHHQRSHSQRYSRRHLPRAGTLLTCNK
jgi:hypothetical protein